MFSGAWPVWDLDAIRLTLSLLRGCWLTGLLSTGGALLFRALEPELPPAVRMRLLRLIIGSLAAAALAWLGWVALQVVVLAHGGAIWPVLRQTAFGQFAVAQLALLAAAALSLRFGRWLPAGLALAAVALQVTHLHAWAMRTGLDWLTAAALLHVLGAAAWLGGLLPLRLAVRHASPALAAAASRRFSRRATWFVATLAGSALAQGWDMLGGVPGVIGTAYGWVALGKAALFAALLGFAARHRWWQTPALARPEPGAAQRALARSIAQETGIGMAVVLAAALLGALPPGMHAQPVWPLAWQISLDAVREDAGFAREAMLAGGGVLFAVLLLALALASRVARWPFLAASLAILWFAAPHLALLAVPANPTSFYRSPTGFAATGIAEGAALYPERCAACHGASGRGDGPNAARLPLPPADLTAPHLFAHADGEMFWWLTHGIAAPDGTPAMPGFATLDEDERWQLIDFVRARNAGLAHAATGGWPVQTAAPDLDADCAGGRSVSLRELRGQPVRLAFQNAAGTPPAPVPGFAGTTVLVPRAGAAEAAGGDCIASDPSVLAAYAVVTGIAADKLAGTDVLIDANGWLRDVLPPGAPTRLAAALRAVTSSPLPRAASPNTHPM